MNAARWIYLRIGFTAVCVASLAAYGAKLLGIADATGGLIITALATGLIYSVDHYRDGRLPSRAAPIVLAGALLCALGFAATGAATWVVAVGASICCLYTVPIAKLPPLKTWFGGKALFVAIAVASGCLSTTALLYGAHDSAVAPAARVWLRIATMAWINASHMDLIDSHDDARLGTPTLARRLGATRTRWLLAAVGGLAMLYADGAVAITLILQVSFCTVPIRRSSPMLRAVADALLMLPVALA